MDSSSSRVFRVVTRASQLAVVQTEYVVDLLKKAWPELSHDRLIITRMTTVGDQRTDVPLAVIGGQGVFTKELERELLANRADIAVHSLKDLPTINPPGLIIGATPVRAARGDALVLNQRLLGHTIDTLPAGTVIGTSSLRRTALLKRRYPHLVFKDIRGNLNTRLRKLDVNEYDALILACAGLDRLGWGDRISQRLAEDDFLYAPAQGALGVQCRADDVESIQLLSRINDQLTNLCTQAERAFLRTLEGGCRVPIATCARVSEDQKSVQLIGQVWNEDGSMSVRGDVSGSLEEGASLGVSLAGQLKDNGADEILREVRAMLAAIGHTAPTRPLPGTSVDPDVHTTTDTATEAETTRRLDDA
eukprot:GILK01004393.1.p1 GENE.GILK01004393.1~~GILK01004393.1.p1  ORF type:complete len:370 (-),score=60.79 GILK01004393.1:187-1272(-)